MLLPQIIYEDADILVISKSAGMVVNRSETVGEGRTVQDWLQSRHPELTSRHPELGSGSRGIPKRVRDDSNLSVQHDNIEKDFFARSGIVHRLDKDTSGVLVIAKTPQAFFDLQRQFKERLVKKTYLALVHGRFSGRPGLSEGQAFRGEISAPVGRDPKNRQRFAVVADGRPAVTRYRVLRTFASPFADPKGLRQTLRVEFSLLQIEPLTGRTHQLRVHLAHINHPVVADPWYAGRKTARFDRSFCPRLFLHAQSLGFTHPRTGAWLKVEAALPEDLQRVLQNLLEAPKK